MLLSSQTKIRSTPDKVIDFLVHLEEPGQYQHWHPKDHIWLKKMNNVQGLGAKFRFYERIGNRKVKLSFRISKITPTHLRFEPTGIASVLRLGRADYRFIKQKNRWVMHASLRLGWGSSNKVWLWPVALDIRNLYQHLLDEEHFLANLG